MVAALEVRRHAAEHRRHAAGEGDAILGAFEQHHLGDELVGIGVGVPAVDVALLFLGEQCAGLFGVIEDEARREVQRRGMLTLGAAWRLRADRDRIGMQRAGGAIGLVSHGVESQDRCSA